jgi:NAD(P)-dependent dehydrogenase (short-subunit alcohol dehydrogenase family)
MAEPRSLGDLLSLRGRRAVITGAAAGIGRAIACRFAEAGADLELIDVDEERLASLGAALIGTDVVVRLHAVNIADADARAALWADWEDNIPGILVNNAGIYPFRQFLHVDEPFYQNVLAVNLDAVYWMCQELIRRRLKQGGVIINVGSIEAVQAFKGDLAHYAISKAGVVALTRSLAKEHGKHGFRVNAILPGGVVTQGTRDAAKGVLRFDLGLVRTGLAFRERLPLGRLGQPDEVACMALVLASDLASYVHGAAVPIDGGFLAA